MVRWRRAQDDQDELWLYGHCDFRYFTDRYCARGTRVQSIIYLHICSSYKELVGSRNRLVETPNPILSSCFCPDALSPLRFMKPFLVQLLSLISVVLLLHVRQDPHQRAVGMSEQRVVVDQHKKKRPELIEGKIPPAVRRSFSDSQSY